MVMTGLLKQRVHFTAIALLNVSYYNSQEMK